MMPNMEISPISLPKLHFFIHLYVRAYTYIIFRNISPREVLLLGFGGLCYRREL